MKIDKIIISADDHPDYLPFLKIIGPAWKKLMGITPTFLYVSDKDDTEWMRNYVEVVRIPNHIAIPSGNQAMASRMLMATQFGEQVCMLSDIDLLPLTGHTYFSEAVKDIPDDHMAFIGGNAFNNPNKFPICYMIGKGNTFSEILNPGDRNYGGVLEDMLKHNGSIPQCSIAFPKNIPGKRFCDESLFSDFFSKWSGNPSRTVIIDREWDSVTNVASRRVDRSMWAVDTALLASGGYVDSHMPRPMQAHAQYLKPLTDSIGIDWPT